MKEADRLYNSAAALSETYVTPRRNLAILIDKQGRSEEAIKAFEELVRVPLRTLEPSKNWTSCVTQRRPPARAKTSGVSCRSSGPPSRSPTVRPCAIT